MLAIDGKNVKAVGTVSVATQPTAAVATPPPALPVAVAISPDGKRALVVKSGANRVGLLDIDGQKVRYAQVDGKNYDMATGLNLAALDAIGTVIWYSMLRAKWTDGTA